MHQMVDAYLEAHVHKTIYFYKSRLNRCKRKNNLLIYSIRQKADAHPETHV